MSNTSFEEKIAELQKIVNVLEDETTSLEECIKLYDKGCKLAAQCSKILDSAETKISKMTLKDGEYIEEQFITEEG